MSNSPPVNISVPSVPVLPELSRIGPTSGLVSDNVVIPVRDGVFNMDDDVSLYGTVSGDGSPTSSTTESDRNVHESSGFHQDEEGSAAGSHSEGIKERVKR